MAPKVQPPKSQAGGGSFTPLPTDEKASKPNPYGLGDWGDKFVRVGALLGGTAAAGGLIGGLTGAVPVTANEAMNRFVTLQNNDAGLPYLAQIQQWLYQAGLYSDKNYTPIPGRIRPEDFAAFRNALRISTESNMDLGEYLRSSAAVATQFGIGAAQQKPTPNVESVSNPLDIEHAALKGYQAAIGRGPSEKEKAAVIAAVQQAQKAYQDRAYELNTTGGTGVAVQPPDASSFAEQQAREQNPHAAESHGLLDYYDSFLTLMGGGS